MLTNIVCCFYIFNIIVVILMILAGYVARMGEKRNAYRILMEKRPLGRPKYRLVNNIKMDLREINGMVWIGLIWLRIGTSEGLL
jgi:hypothetical protein